MKAADLRSGNLFWVLHEESESLTVANFQHIKSLEDYEDDPDDDRWSRGTPCDYYEGIPLNEQWLTKFGFEKLSNFEEGHTDEDYVWQIEVEGSPSIIFQNSAYYEDDYGVKLIHVHQLQNLFYALTGTELTIKEK